MSLSNVPFDKLQEETEDAKEKKSDQDSKKSGSRAESAPQPVQTYLHPKKTIKKGTLEDVYPWIKLLPERVLTPAAAAGTLDQTYYTHLHQLNEPAQEIEGTSDRDSTPVIDTRGMAPKTIDDRGRIRGGCTDCDCDEFERAPKGAECHYCHCAPCSHELLWPPPPQENQPEPSGEENDEDTKEEVAKDNTKPEDGDEANEKYAPSSTSRFGGFLENFRKKIRSPTSEEEMEAAKRAELEEIKEQMEKEIDEFEKIKRDEFEKLKEIWSELYFKSLPEERCAEDKRGILRGRCRDCDCDGFESDLPATTTCAYCGCAPTYHVAKIDYFTERPLEIHNQDYVNTAALKNWKRKSLAASVTEQGGNSAEETASRTNETHTVYQNQNVIDAAEDGVTYKDTVTVRSRAGSIAGTIKSYDEAAERKKLTDPDKKKATVAEIYPWIKEEAEPKRKITNLAQLVKDSKRKGMSKRHNLILDLTEEVRTLRAEVEDVLFYDNEETLQTVLQDLWEEHHKLIQRFEEFMTDLTVDSPLPTPLRTPTPVETPEDIREDRARRRLEWRFKSLFKPTPVDEGEADKEFEKSVKPSKFDV